MGLAERDALVAVGARLGGLAQHQRLHRGAHRGLQVATGQHGEQAVGVAADLGALGATGELGPFVGAHARVVANRAPHALAQGCRQRLGERDDAAQRVGLTIHRAHRAVVRAPGVVGQERKGQRKQHADDVDEGRRHPFEAAHPACPARGLREPLDQQHADQRAEHGNQGKTVVVVGMPLGNGHRCNPRVNGAPAVDGVGAGPDCAAQGIGPSSAIRTIVGRGSRRPPTTAGIAPAAIAAAGARAGFAPAPLVSYI